MRGDFRGLGIVGVLDQLNERGRVTPYEDFTQLAN